MGGRPREAHVNEGGDASTGAGSFDAAGGGAAPADAVDGALDAARGGALGSALVTSREE
jgi:hypothetical protein